MNCKWFLPKRKNTFNKNLCIHRMNRILKDGVSIAKEVKLLHEVCKYYETEK